MQINDVVTNEYKTNKKTDWRGFWGVGIGHTFEKEWFSNYQFSLGIAGYGINLGQVQGVEYPFINDGQYDTLNYKFQAKSSTGMLESRLAYTQFNWQPIALIGIGKSWNRLSGYNEQPTDPFLSASPVSPGFNNQTKQAFAYELGVGLQRKFLDDTVHKIQYKGSVSYRYFNLGKGLLGSFPAQTSNDRLQIKNLYTQAILFSLDVSFN